VKQKVALKDMNIRTQINEIFNDISSPNKINNTLEPLFTNYQQTYSLTDLELHIFEHNNAGLKKTSSVVWTANSSAFLNAMCVMKYVLNYEQHFSYSDPVYQTSRLTLTGLTRVYCICIKLSNIWKTNGIIQYATVTVR
jgi:hypothetical protein